MTAPAHVGVPELLQQYDRICETYKEVIGDGEEEITVEGMRAYEVYEDGLTALIHELAAAVKNDVLPVPAKLTEDQARDLFLPIVEQIISNEYAHDISNELAAQLGDRITLWPAKDGDAN